MVLYKATITGGYPDLVWYVEASNIGDATLKFRIKLADRKDTLPLRIARVEEAGVSGKKPDEPGGKPLKGVEEKGEPSFFARVINLFAGRNKG